MMSSLPPIRFSPPLAGFSLALLLASQAEAQPLPVRVDDAIRHALAQRVDVRAMAADMEASQARLDAAQAGQAPRVELGADWTRTKNYDTFSGTEVEATIQGVPIRATVTREVPLYQASMGLRLEWKLYEGGAGIARVDSARAALGMSLAQRMDLQRRLIVEVATAYGELVKAQDEARWARARLKAETEYAETRGLLLRSGSVSRLDRQATLLSLERARMRDARAQLAWRAAWRAYGARLGATPADAQEGEPPLVMDDADGLAQALSRWQGAVAAAPSTATRQAAQAAWAEARIEAGQLKPQLNLFAGYSHVGRDERTPVRAVQDLSRQQYYLGLRLNWTLFDGGGLQSRLRGAQAQAIKADWLAQEDEQRRVDELASLRDRVAELDAQWALSKSEWDMARLEAQVGQAKLGLRQITAEQQNLLTVASDDAHARLQRCAIDLAVAKFALEMR